ncbi:MAG: ComF family protein [Deltaproteobacteria bacterium]|nr:ComF family protein [Deltaproteobacteria bacterium]MBI3294821.1 ComF family protein [Deltaproteobacteria bacterium]
MPFLAQFFDQCLIELVSPQCLVCGVFCRRGICEACDIYIPFAGHCENCGRENGSVSGCCLSCAGAGFAFDLNIQSVFWLNRTALAILHRVKLSGEPGWLKLYDDCLGIDPKIGLVGSVAVVPVPLHWTRLMKRTFNQSEVLAKRLAHRHSLAHRPDLLKKVRWTKPQSRSTAAGRVENLRSAFRLGRGRIPESVLLVDDVVTSGSTLQECARVLRSAGVQQISAWTLFRTPRG